MKPITVGTMGSYKVNDKKENIFPARVTWINPPEKEGGEGTVDLMVMIHIEDYPEFSLTECAMGHAHRQGVKLGTGPGTFEPTEDPNTLELESKISSLESEVSSLTTAITNIQGELASLKAPH